MAFPPARRERQCGWGRRDSRSCSTEQGRDKMAAPNRSDPCI